LQMQHVAFAILISYSCRVMKVVIDNNIKSTIEMYFK